jgi:hypothetical protein
MDYENIPGNGRDASGEAPGDRTQMVPEIAAAASAAARAGGVPLIADTNGVVVLPQGATLDDIKVVGRDLVVTLDDGQVFVIPEGAIYVPQIVIDGVAVPPLNLAALLIGEAPIQPAAGLPTSSGNNFFEDAGAIQAAHVIGDLLPPTEFGFVAATTLESRPRSSPPPRSLPARPTPPSRWPKAACPRAPVNPPDPTLPPTPRRAAGRSCSIRPMGSAR